MHGSTGPVIRVVSNMLLTDSYPRPWGVPNNTFRQNSRELILRTDSWYSITQAALSVLILPSARRVRSMWPLYMLSGDDLTLHLRGPPTTTRSCICL